MVVFEGGAPKKSDYRRFGIRWNKDRAAPGRGAEEARISDFSSVEEVLSRRHRPLSRSERTLSPHDGTRDSSFAALANLIVIDGGKGQLSAGMRAASR